MADNSMFKYALIGGAAYFAYTQGWLSFLGIGPTTAAAVPAPVIPIVPLPVPVVAPTGVAFNSLDQIYIRMVAAATKDGVTSTGPDVWDAYAVQVGAPNPMPAPEDAGLTRVNMTAAQYWAAMAPVLKTQHGLSGLGIYGGLGALTRRYI